jgi:two-component system, OmpR family, phosphate regulon response regulator PhoB
VLSRKDIIDNVWFGLSVKEGIVDVYIKSLREALGPAQESLVIETVRGAGFRLSWVADMQRAQAEQQSAKPGTQPVAPPVVATPPAHKHPVADDRPRTGASRNPPVLVSDLGAAVEKIRHLQALLRSRQTEENRLLRDAVEASKPMSSGSLAPARHKSKS